ncbi:MAG: type II toxin-antitoxin system PemK/MazF family toxin [Spartobacteria bacterium]
MESPSVGSIVLLPFPFSDLSRSKVRPAVILASAGKGDWILCQITSKSYADLAAVELRDSDFESGGLRLVSYARPSKLFTASGGIFLSIARQLGKEKILKILQRVLVLFVLP